MTADGGTSPIASPRAAFWALFWKELREGAATALIAMAVASLGLFFSTAILGSTGAVGFETSPVTVSLFTLTSAGAAILIGYKQVARDDRGDMWALLTHRPTTRALLFWGKVAPAALLYIAATAIPLTIALMWQATPGNRPAPFDIRMALPDLVDLLSGFVYLFVAMLTAVRDARWYASRLLPFGLGIACTIATVSVDTLPAALGVVALAIVIGATAARGAFVAGGAYAGQSRASRFTLALALGFGLQIAGSIALVLFGGWLATRTPAAASLRTTAVSVTSDGTLARVVSQTRLFDPRPRVVQATDLNGRLLPEFEDSLTRDKALTDGVISAAAVPLSETYAPFGRGTSYRSIERLFVPLLTTITPGLGMTSWYFVRRLGLIAAFDNQSRQQIGWLGPDGFSEGSKPPAGRFQGELRPYSEFVYRQRLIAMPGAVYRLDLENRQIQRVFAASSGDEVRGAASSGDSSALNRLGPLAKFDVIATRDSVFVQSRDGTRELVVPHDPRTAGYGTVTVTRALRAAGTPTFIWYKAAGGTLPRPAIYTARDQVAEFGADGALVAQISVPSGTGLVAPAHPEWAQIVGVGLFTPLASRAAFALVARWTKAGQPLPVQPAGPRIAGWVSTIAGAIVAAILAVIVGHRYAFDNRKLLVWTALGFALGAVGFLLMASLLAWPARERCPSCGQERVVTRDRCEHCGSPFAQPPRDGTEIFGGAWVGVSESTEQVAT